MKTLIIGGSGFVGSELVANSLKKDCVILDKNLSPFFNEITQIGDIRNPHELNFSSDISTVVLLAAEHRDDVSPTSLYYDVNVQGTKNVLDAMDKQGIKNLVFTSSVAVYGLNKENPNESHKVDPFNHYGKSKWMAEQVIQEWYDNNSIGKSVTIIRPTVIFGERNRGNVYNLLKQISSGKFLMIGTGRNKKSMAYVGNVVAFIKEMVKKKATGFEVYNYVDKPDFTMTELVQVVEKKMGLRIPKTRIPYTFGLLAGYVFDFLSFITKKKFAISSVRVRKFCATTQFDATKVQEVFESRYSLENGLERTLEREFLSTKEDDILFFSE